MSSYLKYATPSGCYRKAVIKSECQNPADRFDAISKLRTRVKQSENLVDFKTSNKAIVLSLGSMLGELQQDVTAMEAMIGTASAETFSQRYDILASAHEGILEKFFEEAGEKISEDAAILKKRNYTQKNPQVDLGRSAAGKKAWSRNKHKYKQAIRKFNKSSAGKAFHRNLTRFNRNRIKEDLAQMNRDDILTVAKGLSSMLTHFMMEVQSLTIAANEGVLQNNAQEVQNIREMYHIFEALMADTFEMFFVPDNARLAEVLDIITDYYFIGGEAND